MAAAGIELLRALSLHIAAGSHSYISRSWLFLIQGGSSHQSLKLCPSPSIFSSQQLGPAFAESWHFFPPTLFGASAVDLPQFDTENRVLLPVLENRSHRLLPPQESTRQQVLGATSSRSIARDSKLTRDSATSCGLDVCHGKSTLLTAFQAACRASCSRRERIPVLTWLCLFSLALRASLPAGFEQWQRATAGSTQTRALCLCTHGD